jgi:hypothetical protein
VSADMLSLDSKDCIVYKVRVADDRGEWTVTRRWALLPGCYIAALTSL